MTDAVKQQPTCRCIPCQFNCDAGKWDLNGQAMDCYGCDGSGVDTRCDQHKEKDDDE